MKKISMLSTTIGFVFWFSLSNSAFSAGIYNSLQSTASMGNAFAGAGAAGDDASISFYNPAGLILIDEGQFIISGIYADINQTLTVTDVTDSYGNPKPGAGDEYSAFPNQVSPALFAAAPLGKGFVLGMSVTAPYQLSTDYSDTVIDNTARQTMLTAITGNVSLAMPLTKQLSLGLGGNLQYFKAKLNVTPEATVGDEDPITVSGLTEYKGDDIAFYPNFGLLYELNENARIGFNYRMHVNQETHGNFLVNLNFEEGDTKKLFSSTTPATSLFLFPDILSLNGYYKPVDHIELLADLMFTRWSRFQAVVVNLDQEIFNTIEPVNTAVDFRDTWRIGVGANYIISPEIKLRSGVAFDQSPVTNSTRTFQGPDSNQMDVALGLMYRPHFLEKTIIDIAYMHKFFQSGTAAAINPVANVIHIPETAGDTAMGSFKGSANFFGLQIVQLM